MDKFRAILANKYELAIPDWKYKVVIPNMTAPGTDQGIDIFGINDPKELILIFARYQELGMVMITGEDFFYIYKGESLAQLIKNLKTEYTPKVAMGKDVKC